MYFETVSLSSKIPFEGPVGSCRVAYLDGQYIVHPTYDQILRSQLNMVISSNEEAIIMVEAGSNEVSEQIILEGIKQARLANNETINLIKEMEVTAGQAKVEVSVDPEETEALESQIKSLVLEDLQDVLSLNSFKAERDQGLDKLEEQILEAGGDFQWSNDSRSIIYTVLDKNHRPYAVKRHVLGTSLADDHEVYRGK